MPLTPAQAGALRDRLAPELTKRAKRVSLLEDYRDGDHPLPEGLTSGLGSRKARAARDLHRRLLKVSRSNWCGLVVDAVDERLAVIGFRFDGQDAADEELWRIYQANGLDAEGLLVQGNALASGQAMVSVWPGRTAQEDPIIRAEHPSEVIVAYGRGRRDRIAALKSYVDEEGFGQAVLYTKEEVWKWQTAKKVTGFSLQFHGDAAGRWVPKVVPGEQWPMASPTPGVVPIVEFQANPRLKPSRYGGGLAEFEGVLDIQDRINETVFGRLVSTHYHAFPQKWVTGMDIPTDDSGTPIEPFQSAIDRLLAVEEPDAKFGTFPEATLTGYLSGVEADVKHLAAISKTPPHYLLGEMVNISADALKAAEIGLVSKVRRHQLYMGEAWEEVGRLAMLCKGDQKKGTDPMLEVIWRDPESRSDAQVIDGLVKLGSAPISLPRSEIWARVPGATPRMIAGWEAELVAEDLNAPAPPPPPASIAGDLPGAAPGSSVAKPAPAPAAPMPAHAH